MSSVRERLERLQDIPEQPVPQRANSQSQTNILFPAMSTRQRAEFKESQEPEVLTPPQHEGRTGGFGPANAPMSTRERAERRAAQESAKNEGTPQNGSNRALIDYYADRYLAEQAEEKAKE